MQLLAGAEGFRTWPSVEGQPCKSTESFYHLFPYQHDVQDCSVIHRFKTLFSVTQRSFSLALRYFTNSILKSCTENNLKISLDLPFYCQGNSQNNITASKNLKTTPILQPCNFPLVLKTPSMFDGIYNYEIRQDPWRIHKMNVICLT